MAKWTWSIANSSHQIWIMSTWFSQPWTIPKHLRGSGNYAKRERLLRTLRTYHQNATSISVVFIGMGRFRLWSAQMAMDPSSQVLFEGKSQKIYQTILALPYRRLGYWEGSSARSHQTSRKDPSAWNGIIECSSMNFLLICYRMSQVCESWSLDDLVDMDEGDMERLLGFYGPGTVPTFQDIRWDDPEQFAFDGSFGWW